MSFTFKIKIQGSSKPPIWRRVRVNKDITFEDLHFIIQDVFDWDNSHLYQFSPKGYRSSPSILYQYDDEKPQYALSDPKTFPKGETYNSEDILLLNYFKKPKQTMVYIYDFGDDWMHSIVLEKIDDAILTSPSCIGGKGKAPMEDSGGIWGYYHMVDAINDETHPRHNDFMEWMGLEKGETWDVHEFDLQATNAKLSRS